MSDIIVVAIISSVSTLLVALIGVLFSYNKTKAETEVLRSQLQKGQAESQKQIEKLTESTRELKQVTSYKNYKQAFQELEDNIRTYLETCKSERIASPTIDLKLIAVAMTFSWEHFILTVIPDLLDDFPTLTINLDIVFVSHKHLQTLKIGHGDIDWLKKSEDRVAEVKEFHQKYRKRFGKRFNFRAKTYANLPHWHGWLFNEDHLYMGRTSWDIYENNLPILKVGQNKYRHFEEPNENVEASERIELFKNWHKYYFGFASEWVVGNSTKSGK